MIAGGLMVGFGPPRRPFDLYHLRCRHGYACVKVHNRRGGDLLCAPLLAPALIIRSSAAFASISSALDMIESSLFPDFVKPKKWGRTCVETLCLGPPPAPVVSAGKIPRGVDFDRPPPYLGFHAQMAGLMIAGPITLVASIPMLGRIRSCRCLISVVVAGIMVLRDELAGQ
jgi:hypothetical protein